MSDMTASNSAGRKAMATKQRGSELLDQLADRLPADQLAILRRQNFAGEGIEVASNLAALLVRREIPVSASEAEALREFLFSFGASSAARYPFLADRDQVLASLTITDHNAG
jgi:hypothetical protein